MWFSVLGVGVVFVVVVVVIVVIFLCFSALTVSLTWSCQTHKSDKMPANPAIYTDSWFRQFQARSSLVGLNSFCFHNVANGLRSGHFVHAESPR